MRGVSTNRAPFCHLGFEEVVVTRLRTCKRASNTFACFLTQL
jgi:hypothetical protein